MMYVGIDPGGSGGVAALSEGGGVLFVEKMPATDRDLLDLFRDLARLEGIEGGARGVIEKVGVMPKQGIVSAFTFGRNVGALHLALAAAEVPFDEVLPAKWQLVMGCRSRGDKNVTKRRAQQLFPHEKVTHAIADALLIAEYCRRTRHGQQPGGEAHGEAVSTTSGQAEGSGYSREEFERDQHGETGERLAGGRRGGKAEGLRRRAEKPDAPRHGAGAKPTAR